MRKDDGLFPTTGPEHSDAVAREEITRYYADRLAEAEAALAAAEDAYRARLAEMDTWTERGEITPDVVGEMNMAPSAIASASSSRYFAASNAAIYRGGDREEALRLGERDQALRRYLTAKGHGPDLGALAVPPPNDLRGGRSRRA